MPVLPARERLGPHPASKHRVAMLERGSPYYLVTYAESRVKRALTMHKITKGD